MIAPTYAKKGLRLYVRLDLDTTSTPHRHRTVATLAPKIDWGLCCRFFVPRSHPAVVNSKIASSRKRGMVLVEPSESLAKVQPRPRGTRSKGGFGDLKKVKIRYFYCRNEETLLECERLVDSTSLIGS